LRRFARHGHDRLELNVNLEECLPVQRQGRSTTITRMVAGLSGAGVYRVDADGQPYVLKISDKSEPAERWRRKLQIQQLAADAGLAPPIVQTDEVRRAVGLDTPFVVPPFVLEAIHWGLTEKPPAPDRPEVLSHNDVNPSNLVYDGEHLMLLDWEVAGRNDPYYDLGAIAVFFRMDAELVTGSSRSTTASRSPPYPHAFSTFAVSSPRYSAPCSCGWCERAVTPALRALKRPIRRSPCPNSTRRCGPVR